MQLYVINIEETKRMVEKWQFIVLAFNITVWINQIKFLHDTTQYEMFSQLNLSSYVAS